jgi:acetyl-CoA synthetase
MTPTEAFERARDALLRNRDDLERARAEFKWSAVEEFNWAWDWFEVFARGNEKTALVVVSETHGVARSSFAMLAERSTRLGCWLRDHGVKRGDRILVMLNNVIPLWETMLAAMKIGAVVIPATTQLTESDVDDRIVRGNVRHMVADVPSTAKVRDLNSLRVRLALDSAPGFTLFSFPDSEILMGTPSSSDRRRRSGSVYHQIRYLPMLGVEERGQACDALSRSCGFRGGLKQFCFFEGLSARKLRTVSK